MAPISTGAGHQSGGKAPVVLDAWLIIRAINQRASLYLSASTSIKEHAKTLEYGDCRVLHVCCSWDLLPLNDLNFLSPFSLETYHACQEIPSIIVDDFPV